METEQQIDIYRCTYHVSEPLHVSPDVFTFW